MWGSLVLLWSSIVFQPVPPGGIAELVPTDGHGGWLQIVGISVTG